MRSFLVITMLVVISGAVSYLSLNKIKSAVFVMAEQKLPQKELISNSIISMQKAISGLKSYAMSYKDSDIIIDDINKNINKLNSNLTKLSSTNKDILKIIKSTNNLKNIVKELVTVHKQKRSLYFEYNNRLYNIETFFYYLQNGHQEKFRSWHKGYSINNKRIKKYIDKYAKAYKFQNEKDIEKYSRKVIKTASRTINMIETSEKMNFEYVLESTQLNQVDR